MATSAARGRAKNSSNGAPQRTRGKPESTQSPQRWWQWVLVYPTLALSLLTASPQWLDQARGKALGVPSASESEKQAQLWQKNRSCAGLPSKGFLNPSNVAVDATICDSGDILVRAVTPQDSEIFKWLAIDDVVRAAPQGGGLIPAANAATLTTRLASSGFALQTPTVKLALLQVNVICTKSDGRFLLRRIQTPQGCFDEVIDTYTGALVSRNSAPCVPQC